MIIELYGLPGSGKTTHAKNLVANYEYVLIPNPKNTTLEKLSASFRHPGIVLFFLREIIFETIKNKTWLLVIFKISVLFSTLIKIIKASKCSADQKVLIDEGLLQRILSIYETKLSASKLKQILLICAKHFNEVIIIDSKYECFKRYKDPKNLRILLGNEYFEQWKEAVIYNHELIKRFLIDINIPHKLIK